MSSWRVHFKALPSVNRPCYGRSSQVQLVKPTGGDVTELLNPDDVDEFSCNVLQVESGAAQLGRHGRAFAVSFSIFVSTTWSVCNVTRKSLGSTQHRSLRQSHALDRCACPLVPAGSCMGVSAREALHSVSSAAVIVCQVLRLTLTVLLCFFASVEKSATPNIVRSGARRPRESWVRAM